MRPSIDMYNKSNPKEPRPAVPSSLPVPRATPGARGASQGPPPARAASARRPAAEAAPARRTGPGTAAAWLNDRARCCCLRPLCLDRGGAGAASSSPCSLASDERKIPRVVVAFLVGLLRPRRRPRLPVVWMDGMVESERREHRPWQSPHDASHQPVGIMETTRGGLSAWGILVRPSTEVSRQAPSFVLAPAAATPCCPPTNNGPADDDF